MRLIMDVDHLHHLAERGHPQEWVPTASLKIGRTQSTYELDHSSAGQPEGIHQILDLKIPALPLLGGVVSVDIKIGADTLASPAY